jgi:hypothetical protein
MMGATDFSADGRTVTVRVTMSIRRRGGRKLVLAPDGSNLTAASACRPIDNAMVKALARAFRWREMLENDEYATIAEIAAAKKINESYVARVLRLTLLAPDIVEAILDGWHSPQITIAVLMKPLPVGWRDQRATLLADDNN